MQKKLKKIYSTQNIVAGKKIAIYDKNPIFKNQSNKLFCKYINKYILIKRNTRIKALILDSDKERTAKHLIKHCRFTKKRIDSYEKEKNTLRLHQNTKHGCFTKAIKNGVDGRRYGVIFADYQGNSDIVSKDICRYLPNILSKNGGIIAITTTPRGCRKHLFTTMEATKYIKKKIINDLHIGAKKCDFKMKLLKIKSSKRTKRGPGTPATTYYFWFSKLV